MGRMSPRIMAPKFGMTTQGLYKVLNELGLVVKDSFGDWALTDAGKSVGGKMSKSNYPVPTFDFDTIAKMIKERRKSQ
ncbi:MAG: hypothetical protein LUG60_06925 [Erysipelotrichaceae bacterium]|nr:hypothetical protein [Erysipelotrichaceae bacterium]